MAQKAYTGSCEDMCPEKERNSRYGTTRMSLFESDLSTMVKEYRRAGADQEQPDPSDLRTPEALNRTMQHLIYNIIDDPRSTQPNHMLDWYDFLWDRLRAIRKDITQQNICDINATLLVEKCALFHIHACYAMNDVKDFEMGLNRKNLNDCLQMLRQMYSDLKNFGISCPNEVEFIKYDILLHMDEDHSSTNVLLKTTQCHSAPEIKFTLKIYRSYINNDYYTFFRLMKQADYMTSCILSLFVSKMRILAFRIFANSLPKLKMNFPIESMIELLGLDDINDLHRFLGLYDVEVSDNHIVINKSSFKQSIKIKEHKFKKLVEDKIPSYQERKVGHIIGRQDQLPERLEQQKSQQHQERLFQKLLEQQKQQMHQQQLQKQQQLQIQQEQIQQQRLEKQRQIQQLQQQLQQQQQLRQQQYQQQQQKQQLQQQYQYRRQELQQKPLQQQEQQQPPLQPPNDHQQQQQQKQKEQEPVHEQKQQQQQPQQQLLQNSHQINQQRQQKPREQPKVQQEHVQEENHQQPSQQHQHHLEVHQQQQEQQQPPQHVQVQHVQQLEHLNEREQKQQDDQDQDDQYSLEELEKEQNPRLLKRSVHEVADMMPAGFRFSRSIKRPIEPLQETTEQNLSPLKRILLSIIHDENLK